MSLDGSQPNFKYSNETARVIRCATNVHNELGNGYPEAVYQRALAIEFQLAGIPFDREFTIPLCYKGQSVGSRRPDFLVFKNISVELKAVMHKEDGHLAQAKNYLEAYNLEVGLLINFGARSLEFNRLFNKKFKP